MMAVSGCRKQHDERDTDFILQTKSKSIMSNRKSFPMNIIRREWILQKYLIWITLAIVTCFFLECTSADVMCYECAWQGSTPLPSTNDGVSDVCRPHNFNVDVVHKIKCANGCIKQALYEFDLSSSSTTRGNTSNFNSNRTRSVSLDNMTFYVRGCQKDKKTREACENKSFNDQVYAEECVCLSDYCNGERSSGVRSRLFSAFTKATWKLQPVTQPFIIPDLLTLFNKRLLELTLFSLICNFASFNLLSPSPSFS